MTDLSSVIVTISDVRAAGFCVRGARRWFERHDMSFTEFLSNGCPADKFIEKGDDLAQQVVNHKLEREARG